MPALEVVEISDAAICCGSAGIYNLVEPEAAQELGGRKVRNVVATGADAVVTSNPGCLLQILSGLEKAGEPLPVMHLVELLDASICGRRPPAPGRHFFPAVTPGQSSVRNGTAGRPAPL